jgi:hypothetical protein
MYVKFVAFAVFFMGYFIQANIMANKILTFEETSTGYFNVVALLGHQFY